MSYTRQYSEIVSGSKTETVAVSYPASQNGGTTYKTVTLHIDIPVNVNIHVDTNPFDNSVRNTEKNITLLTGAVVATHGAAILSKQNSARKVGETMINGFFSYVKSEISQQVSEITQQTQSLLLHLKNLAVACVGKKEQMTADYHRISSRYVKLFTDLNRELELRIHQLDRPVFLFKELTAELSERERTSGAIGAGMVFHAENAAVEVRVSSAIAKKQAAKALEKITAFLDQQYRADQTIRLYMQNTNDAQSTFIPLCLVEMTSDLTTILKRNYIPAGIAADQKHMVEKYISTQEPEGWMPIERTTQQHIAFYFNKALNQYAPAERLKKTIHQIANIENIQVL